MKNPLVSVIIPCYNQAHFLREAVDSALNSGYENIEIVVVNDGSDKPEQIEIINNFTAPKTRIINQQNAGLPNARNTAIEAAKGGYILPLDADDMTAPGFIGRAVELMEADNDICIVSGQPEFFGDCKTHQPQTLKYEGLDTLLGQNCFMASSMFRRSDWQATGGYSDMMREGLEDWDFWISILKLGEGRKPIQIPELSLLYRISENSMLRNILKDNDRLYRLIVNIAKRHMDLYVKYPRSLMKLVTENIYLHPTIRVTPAMASKYFERYHKYHKLFRTMLFINIILILTTAFTLIFCLWIK